MSGPDASGPDVPPPGPDDEEAVRALIRRAAAAVDVGPIPSPEHVIVGPGPRGRRGLAVLAVAAAVAAVAVLVLRPWEGSGSGARVVTGADPTAVTTTPNPPPPDLGRAVVVAAGMEGLRPPSVSVPDVSATEGPSGELLLPSAWTFTPPPHWTGGDVVRVTASGSGGSITGFAESSDGRRSVAAFTSIPGVTAPPGAPGVVQAEDGTPWTVRSVDADGSSVVAFSVDRDGHAALLFTGLEPSEWTAVLRATASADPAAPGFDGGAYGSGAAPRVPGLPADLADRWRGTRSVSRTMELTGPDARPFTVEVVANAAPDALEQRVAAASALVWDPGTAKVLATRCARGDTVVCARTTPSLDGSVEAFVSAWRDGTRVDVAARPGAGVAPGDLQVLLDQMGAVPGGLGPAG